MTTITLDLDWLTNESLAVLVNQLEALPDNGPDGVEIKSAWLDTITTLHARERYAAARAAERESASTEEEN